jgi:hypothetical protein
MRCSPHRPRHTTKRRPPDENPDGRAQPLPLMSPCSLYVAAFRTDALLRPSPVALTLRI